MSLADLTDPAAVLAAMDECDRLGRAAFLDRYAFGAARDYFLEYNGRRYDSKAIAGVAHRHEFGIALRSSEFTGGKNTVARKLNELGFVVTAPSLGWSIAIGALVTRGEVAQEYGGSIYSGIEPSSTSLNVMLYSDPAAGEEHGYYDGWVGGQPGAFEYTGSGQVGDHKLTGSNKRVLEHAQDGSVLRLFFTLPGPAKPGGRVQRYVGAFRVDPEFPLRWTTGPDRDGAGRKVVVFRLLPDEVVGGYPQDPVAQPTVGARQQPAPEREDNFCPTCFLALPATGQCDNCD